LQKKEGLGELQGLRNGRHVPYISHLFFADDIIFFSHSDSKTVTLLAEVLSTYCQASGKKINLQNSSIFFESKCPDSVKVAVKDKLGVTNEIL
jgi:hypothetical protein